MKERLEFKVNNNCVLGTDACPNMPQGSEDSRNVVVIRGIFVKLLTLSVYRQRKAVCRDAGDDKKCCRRRRSALSTRGLVSQRVFLHSYHIFSPQLLALSRSWTHSVQVIADICV